MQLKHALSTAVLAVPLLLAGAAPSTANIEVGLGAESPYYDGYYGPGYYRYGWGSGYYGLAPYDPYDDEVFLGAPVDVDDNAIVVEPSAAVPVPCVKTNVKNLRNACPM